MAVSDLITRALHRVAANPWVYDQIQRMAGREEIYRYLKTQFAPVQSAPFVLDIGGGTGSVRQLWPASCNYICLDNDTLKLAGLAAKQFDSWRVLADGLNMPIKSTSLDVALCIGVSHHIPTEVLIPVVSDTLRILKPSGRFIFLDATWNPDHSIGRFMWKYDRGSTPHTANELETILSRAGSISRWETFEIYHRYVLAVVMPR